MMVLSTNLVFFATGSPSTSPGDLELVLLLLFIFFASNLKQLTLAFWTIIFSPDFFVSAPRTPKPEQSIASFHFIVTGVD